MHDKKVKKYDLNKNEKNSEIKHYQKINILGDTGVGKTSLISLIEKYNDDDFRIVNNNLSQSQISIESYNNSSSLVEQIKRVEISINENKKLYFNLYETNLDNYDYIKMNLDTLLLQTECIIIMWDISKPDTFGNIPNLISTIYEGIQENKFRDVPIYLIQNKKDLWLTNSLLIEFNDNISSIEIMKKENKNIIFKDISLLENDNFYDLILDINRNMDIYKENQINKNDVVYLVKFNDKPNKLKINNDKDKDNNILLKFILLGYSCVGKSTFFKYFLGQRNKDSFSLSTIGIDSMTINAEINKEKLNIQLFDTAGQERYKSLSKNYIKNADGILLLFDVTNKESFESLDQWIFEINETENNIGIILIGNKIDDTKNRVISKKEAKETANKYNIKYFECCCINGLNLYEVLKEIFLIGYNKYYENNKETKRNNSIKLEEKNQQKEKNKKCCI